MAWFYVILNACFLILLSCAKIVAFCFLLHVGVGQTCRLNNWVLLVTLIVSDYAVNWSKIICVIKERSLTQNNEIFFRFSVHKILMFILFN